MTPTTAEKPDNEDLLFLLSCLHNADTPDWKEVATLNGIANTKAVPAQKHAQRKFKRIVDGSGKYKLENGKVVLKAGDGTASAPATPSTPTTPASGQKRGRQAGSTKSKKKAKKADGRVDEENDKSSNWDGEDVKKEANGEDDAAEDAV